MPYKILEHTGDLKMEIIAESQEDLFSEALLGMMGFIKKLPYPSEHQTKREINVSSADLTSLLIDFLGEALALSNIHKEIYNKIIFKNFSDTSLKAELEGIPVESFDEDIKAVTYHGAEIKNSEGKWSVNLIFDI
jgi:SHS2 domain-containing protein